MFERVADFDRDNDHSEDNVKRNARVARSVSQEVIVRLLEVSACWLPFKKQQNALATARHIRDSSAAILESMLCSTGSQCNPRRNSVKCERNGTLQATRAIKASDFSIMYQLGYN